jgi:hypothetical protein
MPQATPQGNQRIMTTDKVPSEDHEQMMLVQWFRRTYPEVRIFSVPNGGHRHPAVAAKMKATGVVKGVPDLFIPAWGLWVEMKRTKGGSLSAEQKDWIAYLESVGFCCIVGKGADDAKRQISAFFNKRKETL